MSLIRGVLIMAERIKGSIYFKLFAVFFRVGLFTIGGGYAMLPMLRKEVVEKYGWATDEEMLDYFAIGQSTPGIIAINTSTFIGFKKAGVLGAIMSTLGMVTPSWIIIISIAKFFDAFADNQYVASAFMGIRVVVVVLILNAVIKMGKKSITNWIQALIAVTGFSVIVFTPLSPIYVVIVSGLLGILITSFKEEAKV
jgi:chromate transporter